MAWLPFLILPMRLKGSNPFLARSKLNIDITIIFICRCDNEPTVTMCIKEWILYGSEVLYNRRSYMTKICPFVREKVTHLDCLDCGNRGYCDENPEKKHVRDYSDDESSPQSEMRGEDDV